MNRKYQHGLALIIIPVLLVIVILLLSFVALFQYKKNATYDNNTSTTEPMNENITDLKTFKSEVLEIEIDLPKNYEVEERHSSISFFTQDGEIKLLRNGTEFDSLDGHIEHIIELNKLTFEKATDMSINSLTVKRGLLNGELTYFIYTDNTVYSLSTTEESLYQNLDQIAHSFRYIPN